MSQEGIIDIIGTHPEIPTEFIANVGTAVPIANQIELLGEVIAAAGVPFQSVASGNTVTYQIQYSSAVAASDATAVGVSAFDSAFFSVNSSGFVTFSGSTFTQLQVDAHTAPGTDPVVPNTGVITVTGSQVAAGVVGTNVIRTDSLSANTMTIEIQRSSAQAVTTLASNGVSHFDSAGFGVDANGFVTLNSSALGVLSVIGTLNRITSSGGQNPVIDISASYVGQSSITTLGTIATGVWQGTIVGVTYGGTGINGSSAANGTLLIGNGTGYTLATLTASTGVSITNGAGSITIAATGSGMATVEVTGTSQAMDVDTFYIANNAGLVTLTLPVTAALGSIIEIAGKGAGGWLIAQNVGQQIRFGSANTTSGVGGSLASTNQWDSIRLRCITANTLWSVIGGPEGNITWV